ncbi:MAG: glycosyltransferase family 4 protein [Anaerolineae bacterium]|nr:glycosyltransferase family 4 protein [Anaerolineae bacterium]
MKITLCTHRFLPRFSAGVEVYTLRLAKALKDWGHQVHLISGEPESRPDLSVEVREEVYDGLPLTRICYDFERRAVHRRAAYNDPSITAEIQASLRRWQPELVHATSLSLLMAGAIEAAAELHLPLVYTASDFVLTCRRGTYLTGDNRICAEKETHSRCAACMGPQGSLEIGLERLWRLTPKPLGRTLLPRLETALGKKADFVHAAESIAHRLNYLPHWRQQISRIIAPSSHMRDMFVLNGYPTQQIVVSPYGVELPPANFRKTQAAQLRFGFIGRITPVKGVHLLVEAFKQLPQPGNARLTIYGGPDLRATAYSQALQAQAGPYLHFAGPVENSRLADLYQELDVLVVPSIWVENSPITILEAQAYHTPVIASDLPGIAYLIQNEVNGLIFPNHNAEALAGQMFRCLASPQLVAQLTTASRPVMSITDEAQMITELYQNVIDSKSS